MPLGGDRREDAIQALKRNKAELRRALSRETALKFTPDLRFVIDETFDRMDETRALFARDEVRRDLDDAADGGGGAAGDDTGTGPE